MGMSGPARALLLSLFSLALVNFGPAQRIAPAYLSPERLALAKFAVEEAAKRGMKVWLADEGSYPSGLAGGKISKEFPQLSMQGLAADIRIRVAPEGRARQPYGWEAISLGIREATSSCHRKG